MSQKYLLSEKQQLLNAIGTELSWGWSPAIDFTSILKPTFLEPSKEPQVSPKDTKKAEDWMGFLNDEDEQPIPSAPSQPQPKEQGANVLLCGASDIRHIFKTLAELRAISEGGKEQPQINFYIYEPNLRVHARHLLFIQWLCDSVLSLSELEDRVAVFLEAFGNSMVREITAAHIKHETTKVLKAMRDKEGPLAGLIDFTGMKSKEKDFIEEQMQAWLTDTKSEAKIEDNWLHRLRTEMAERFDNCDNIVDWDFNFGLMEHTNALRYQEYRMWRKTGVAYDYCHINPRKGVNYDYVKPNKTLCHFGRSVKGVRHGAYVGDVKNGPFYSFGITTENKALLTRTIEGQVKFGNGVIAMHNIRAMLYQLLCGKRWPWAEHIIAWDDPSAYNYLPPNTPTSQEFEAKLPKVKFHFIGLDLERFLFTFKDEGKVMHSAFVGSNCTQFMSPSFFHSLHPEAVVIAETIKFVLDASDEAKEAFVGKIRDLCSAGGWTHDPRLTAKLHVDVPEMRKREGIQTEGQKRTEQRYVTPYQLAFRKQ